MTAAWQVVYTDDSSSGIAYLCGGGKINLTPMQAGDHIDIRTTKRLVSGGDLVNHDLIGYDDARPADHVAVSLASIPDVYGVEIAMRQTAGPLVTLECEFFPAKVLGTS